jgi:hypothetical protein
LYDFFFSLAFFIQPCLVANSHTPFNTRLTLSQAVSFLVLIVDFFRRMAFMVHRAVIGVILLVIVDVLSTPNAPTYNLWYPVRASGLMPEQHSAFHTHLIISPFRVLFEFFSQSLHFILHFYFAAHEAVKNVFQRVNPC